MRSANAIDFWRGFALVTIFINHVPGIAFERFTTRNLSISDSAELFVFLAGWSLRFVVRAAGRHTPAGELTLRLFGRALRIYGAQILITMVALAMIAGAALLLDQPLLFQWHNAAAVFEAPAVAHIGLVGLTHQLGYFNILPLYVVLMVAAPAIALLDRASPWLLAGVSFSLWAAALMFGVNLPTWPVEGRWFFNPLSWQFIFVLGFVFARPDRGPGALARKHMALARVLAIPLVLIGAAMAFHQWSPPVARLPEPRLAFMFDKTFLSPSRVVHFLAAAAVFSVVWPRLPKAARPVSAYLAALGRNSLNVFCVGSLLSLAAQIVRYAAGGGIMIDIGVLAVGLIGMGLSAWMSEWRERSRAAFSRAG